MDNTETLKHTRWDCKSQGGFLPQYRRKAVSKAWRPPLGEVLRDWASQQDSRVEEGPVLPDPVHRWLSLPPT